MVAFYHNATDFTISFDSAARQIELYNFTKNLVKLNI